MKMCDRCRVPGCLLDYNGKACENARKEHCPDVVFTNSDHIRSMSDEELAKFFIKLMNNAKCFAEGMFPYHPCPQSLNCRECAVGWLKQPYEEKPSKGS